MIHNRGGYWLILGQIEKPGGIKKAILFFDSQGNRSPKNTEIFSLGLFFHFCLDYTHSKRIGKQGWVALRETVVINRLRGAIFLV